MNGSRWRKIFSNGFLCAAIAVTVCFLLFNLAANFLYPWRGDDFCGYISCVPCRRLL